VPGTWHGGLPAGGKFVAVAWHDFKGEIDPNEPCTAFFRMRLWLPAALSEMA